MTKPPLALEQFGRKWRVVRTDADPRWRFCSPPVSKKEAEWFMAQLQERTEDADDEWAEIKIEAEREDYERMLEGQRPAKVKWVRKARAEGRLPNPPYKPQMTKARYLKLLKAVQEEEKANREKGESP